ncbi:MAG: glycosyl hydrolase, partial [Eudoraea sp.]|nr:glycosyl hydrolase [Eudoraea sp.]
MRNTIIKSIVLSLLLVTGLSVSAQWRQREADPTGFEFRNLGAFRISAWVGELAIPLNPGEKHKNTWYVAPRAGGVWKTTNRGTTFECISDEIGTSYIGDVEVAPSDPDIVWIGTGEDFNARSSYYGNGIWKSTDAGETWVNSGLELSSHIAEITIHPGNPDIVWVAVMGNLYSENEERGVYKTTDGGSSWNKVLYIDAATGVIDLALNPENPDIIYASSYQKVRLPWTFEPGGEKSRIYKSVDGGIKWDVIKGGGFPEGPLGRIGIDLQYNNPDVLVAVVQNLNVKDGVDPDAPVPFDEFTDHSFDNLIGGETYRSFDAGKTWERLNDPEEIDVSGKAAYSFNKICIDPDDPDKIFIIGAGMYYTLDGGKTWPTGRRANRFRTNFGDNRTLWIDPRDGDHMFLGSDGGIYETWDGGKSMMHHHHLPLGEIYMVEVDRHEPYNIYIGLQDHEVWKGPSNSWSGQIGIEDWVIVGMWDGMYCKVDPVDNRWLYFTSQFGAHHRVDQSTGERVAITPKPPKGGERYRYTWNTPIVLSPHNSKVLYTGGQMLLRSSDQGESWEEISPDLTKNDKVKIAGTGHVMYCTIVSIDESPKEPGLIWVGTDDGKIHMTRNGGEKWTEFTGELEKIGMPHERWTARVAASKHKAGRVYIAKNGYRNDDM